MAQQAYRYVIVGAGVAGASAAEGIIERDDSGSILLIGDEADPPYHRPPLTKGLWRGKKTVPEIFLHPAEYYADHQIALQLGRSVTALDPAMHEITDDAGAVYRYDRLLLATGGRPRHLTIAGSELPGLCYYRYLDDYHFLRRQVHEGTVVTIIGGGFIGSELAAALNINRCTVMLVFPEDYLVARVFPEGLGRTMSHYYQSRGVGVFANDLPERLEYRDGQYITHTRGGHALASDVVVVGAGIYPNVELAESAGLQIDNGIVVDDYLRTSAPDIYAAGDNANFPYAAVGHRSRIEHWDNAVTQGRWAGRNMAGADEPFHCMPYFFSDLFDFGYEAVGEVDSRLPTVADWVKEHDTGVIYYLRDHRVRGVMLCNVWGQLDAARTLIRQNEPVTLERLRGAIPTRKEAA